MLLRTRKDSGIRVLLDTNYLVGWLRETDSQHPRSLLVQEVLREVGPPTYVLDCVYSELMAVLARSYAEENRLADFLTVADKLEKKYWSKLLWFAYIGGEELLTRAIGVCREAAEKHGVGISPHDAMLLIFAAEKRVPFILSFDEQLAKVRTVEGKKTRFTVIDDRNRKLLLRGEAYTP